MICLKALQAPLIALPETTILWTSLWTVEALTQVHLNSQEMQENPSNIFIGLGRLTGLLRRLLFFDQFVGLTNSQASSAYSSPYSSHRNHLVVDSGSFSEDLGKSN